MVEISGIVLQQPICNVWFIGNNNSAQRRCPPTWYLAQIQDRLWRSLHVTIQCSNRLTGDRCKQQLVAWNINAQSVRNKSAVIFYYICDHTPAVVTLTEHWLTDLDSSVRAELCPNGYKILLTRDQIAQTTPLMKHRQYMPWNSVFAP